MPLAVYKPPSKTPLECVRVYRERFNISSDIPVSYAGRLDPMAEGVLLLLVGDENKQRRSYEHQSKHYEVSCVFGISTDTGDGMGIPKVTAPATVDRSQLVGILNTYIGTYEQRYPTYSSRRVDGKPLFYWARHGGLKESKIPTHTVRVSDISLISLSTIKIEEMIANISNRISHVSGDFRQAEIQESWAMIDDLSQMYPMATISVACDQGGTYMRVLAEDLAHDIGQTAFAYHIVRTQVGDWNIDDCTRLW